MARPVHAVLLTALALAAGVLAWQSAGDSPPAAPTTPERVRIALPGVPHTALLHLAAANGYLRDAGIDATLVPASTGKAALDLVTEGQADIAAAARTPLVIAIMNGVPFRIIAAVSTVSSENSVVARRDRGIAAPRDLAGRRVGVSRGTSGDSFLWAFLVRHRVAPESVTLVGVPPDQIAAELALGHIDAAATWPPYVSQSLGALGDNGLAFAEPGIHAVTFALASRPQFLEQHPRAAERLLRALLKAERFAQSQPAEALRIVAAHINADPASLAPTWSEFELRVDFRQSHLTGLEDEARWAMARGLAPAGPVPNFLPTLHLDALLAVDPSRVTVLH